MFQYKYLFVALLLPFLGSTQVTVSGDIALPNALPVCNVLVELVDDNNTVIDQDMSEDDGTFLFSDVPTGVDYTLRFSRADLYNNGLSTLDLVLLSGKILGVSHILPYDYWTGDVNGSMTISTLDMILIHKAILGIDNPSTTPWAFDEPDAISANNEIDLPAFTESVENITVIGVKRGDLNTNVTLNCQ